VNEEQYAAFECCFGNKETKQKPTSLTSSKLLSLQLGDIMRCISTYAVLDFCLFDYAMGVVFPGVPEIRLEKSINITSLR